MKLYEYCGECDAYLGSAVWGLFSCPHCNAKLSLAKYAEEDLEEDEDE